jgi:hypothetical protein
MTREQKDAKKQETAAAEAARRLNEEYRAFMASPPFQKALRQDNENRDLAFLDGPETVAGLKLRQLSAKDLLVLTQLGSPFLSTRFMRGQVKPVDSIPEVVTEEWANEHIFISPADIVKFLWVQSVEFRALIGSAWQRLRARWARRRFIARCRALPYGQTCEAIRCYLDDALCDRPGGSVSNDAPIASWISGDVYFLAKNFGWTEAEILNLPVRRSFQYMRRIIESGGSKSSFFSRADRLKGEFLSMVNARNAAKQ